MAQHPIDPSTRPAARARWARAHADLVGGFAAAGGAFLVSAWVLRLWNASLRVPFWLGGDANLALNGIKNMIRGDWYYSTKLLGAPFGQELFDFPAPGDTINLLLVKSMGLVTSDPALVMNAFFLLTFPLAAVAAFIALRMLKVSRALAIALGIVYSILPYHFLRGEGHLFLSAYFAVPLASIVIIRQMSTATMIHIPRRGEPRSALWSRNNVLAALVAVLISGTGFYYAFFFVLLVALVGLATAARDRSFRPIASAGLLVAIVAGVIAIVNLPSIVYSHDNGNNPLVAERLPSDSDFYGLRIANLVLPVTGHRVADLAALKADSVGGPVPSEGTEALGIIGAIGYVGLLAIAFVGLTGPRRRRGETSADAATINRLAALTITCSIFATIAGGALVIGVLGFSQIRAWNRISVFIAFFSLAAVGLWLTRLLRSKFRTGPAFSLASIALSCVLVLGAAYDQTTPAFAPDYAASSGRYGGDRAFVNKAERVLGRGASVFQLPYVPFPENPPVFGMVDYDHLRGYLHSDTLRWSYGGVKGREAEWQPALVAQPTATEIAGMAAVGFDGLYIDRAGYADRAAQLERDLRGLLGPAQFESEDARLVMYDLRPVRRRLDATLSTPQARRTRDAILHPPQVQFGRGFSTEERDPATETTWHWVQGRAELDIVNTTMHRQRVVISFDIASLTAGANVLVTGLAPGMVLPTPDGRTDVEREVTLTPGVNRVRFAADAADTRFQVVGFRVVAPGLSGVTDVIDGAPAAA